MSYQTKAAVEGDERKARTVRVNVTEEVIRIAVPYYVRVPEHRSTSVSERALRDRIKRRINKDDHPGTKRLRWNGRKEVWELWAGSELLDEKSSLGLLAVTWGASLD